MVKISELKQERIRTQFSYIGADELEHEIIIYNPTPEVKDTIMKLMADNIAEESEMLIDGIEMIKEIYPLLSNIEIDSDDIEDILDNPTKELLRANAEITSICNEIGLSILVDQRLEYERMIVALEQVKCINMLAYVTMKSKEYKPLRDFDPLNADAREALERKDIDEAKTSLEFLKEAYAEQKAKEAEE